MRIAGESLAVDLLAEVDQLLFADAPFEKCAGIEAGRGMPLQVNEIASVVLCRGVPEMIESDIVERRRRGIARDVAAELARLLVRAHDDGHRVPAGERGDATLDVEVARARRLFL